MKRILTLAAAAAALACGSSNSNNAATSHNNPGAGSSTLLVTGDVVAAMSTANPPAPQTTFTVTVKDGANANVSGATVTLSNASLQGGSASLTETQNPIRASQLLTIIRQNEVDAAGGLTGSRLRATYTATVAYTVN